MNSFKSLKVYENSIKWCLLFSIIAKNKKTAAVVSNNLVRCNGTFKNTLERG